MLQYEPKAPYVRNRDSAFTVMMDVVIALLPLYFMAFYFYGLRALRLGWLLSQAAVVSDFVCILLEGKKPYFRDISSVVTGMMLPLMMSAATPYYVVVSASVFAVVFVKHVFGGVGQSAFNPGCGRLCLCSSLLACAGIFLSCAFFLVGTVRNHFRGTFQRTRLESFPGGRTCQ